MVGKATACSLLRTVAAVQVHEADQRRIVEFNSLLGGDFLQRVVDVWQMIGGNVEHESAGDFIVAHAAVQAAEEQNKLHASGNDGGYYGVPVGGRHCSSFGGVILRRTDKVCRRISVNTATVKSSLAANSQR